MRACLRFGSTPSERASNTTQQLPIKIYFTTFGKKFSHKHVRKNSVSTSVRNPDGKLKKLITHCQKSKKSVKLVPPREPPGLIAQSGKCSPGEPPCVAYGTSPALINRPASDSPVGVLADKIFAILSRQVR